MRERETKGVERGHGKYRERVVQGGRGRDTAQTANIKKELSPMGKEIRTEGRLPCWQPSFHPYFFRHVSVPCFDTWCVINVNGERQRKERRGDVDRERERR